MVARKRLIESNGTPAMNLGHMNVVLKWCLCIYISAEPRFLEKLEMRNSRQEFIGNWRKK